MGSYDADALYGVIQQPQPNALPQPTHAPGTPEPTVRTQPNEAHLGMVGNPVFILVALVGIAVVVMHFSMKGGS